MIGLLQRVKNASVTVNDQVIGAVGKGLLILVCAEKGDSEEQCEKLAKKVLNVKSLPKKCWPIGFLKTKTAR